MSPAPRMREVLRAAAAHLARADVPSPRADAEMLAAHVCQLSRAELALATEFPQGAFSAYWELIEARAARVPLQHLTGETGFRYLDLEVRPGVFVPRPETEMVAQVAITAARAMPLPVRIVDLCTGAGGIAISCAQEVPGSTVWAVDLNPEAIALTRANAERNGAPVTAVVGDVREEELLADLAGSIDVVASNPPYIPFGQEPIDPEVREHDPPEALYGGGSDGLEIPSRVVDRARTLLRPGGLLVIEHGDDQGPPMRELVSGRGGFREIHTRQDLTNRDRMVVAVRAEVAN